MSSYKMIILDLDGTTVPSSIDGMPSQRVRETILKAHEFIKVTIASGRSHFYCKKIIEDLKLESPCVLNGGAEIMDLKSGKILFRKFISIEKQKEVLSIVLPFSYPTSTVVDEEKPVHSIQEVNEECGKILLEGVTQEDSIKIIEELEGVDGIIAHPTSSWYKGDVVDLHITDTLATKRHAIMELMKIMNVQKEEVIGVGDHHNDMPLFLSVGFKAVMGNAPKEIKNIADYVAPSLAEDGVADILEKFVLPKL